jgi:hypothetical protein
MNAQSFSGSLDPKFNPFDEDYLVEILEATAVAWARMKQPGPTEIEDQITRRLAGRLLNDYRFAEFPYDVVVQNWLLGIDGQSLGRLDLRFKHRNSQRDYFAFESKRLHVTYPGGSYSAEYSTYAGADGMVAFIDGDYSKGLPASGMLSYVMDGNSDKAWDGLVKCIEGRCSSLKLVESSKLAQSILSKSIANGMEGTLLGETQHDLGTHSLRLFHLLLPVIPNSLPKSP